MRTAVRFEGVTRRFPGVVALEDVTFEVGAGSCHALCGENGAGKSTLGRILAGLYAPDAGRVVVFGQPVRFAGPEDGLAAGIAMVHQELVFCENLSVAENLCLDSLPGRAGFLSRAEMQRRAEQMLAGIGASIDVRRPVGELTVGQQQLLQIAGAVGRGARIIVFDEPTSSLSQHEAERLEALIGRLRTQGVTSIYVSHRMEEIFRLCDTVTVLRDGRHVATQPTAALDAGSLVQMMIGRRLDEYYPVHVGAEPGPELLRVEGLSSPAGFQDVAFAVRGGEVLGFAGLVGAGRTEIARALFGLDPDATGRILVAGRPASIRTPADAMRLGIGLVPEDRKRQGLVLTMSAAANTTLVILRELARLTFVRTDAERDLARQYFDRLRVRAAGLDVSTAGLSGGNQQKLVLAKWLAARCRVLILDEPTRGVDVGAKAEIHGLIDELAAAGNAVILISSELPEVLNLSTRIVVLREGRIAGELPRERATQFGLMRLMAGATAA
ncbi:MAG TPA: sugar ABC transporter ATP-binding protein [Vicinamibacterales bacterium]|nr:sugar ABC transporter ATP-binding protein [Vicinamibacterales bacterium]